jgi:hypothetical protein
MSTRYHMIALAGGALFLASRKKKKKKSSPTKSEVVEVEVDSDDGIDVDLFEEWNEGGEGGLIEDEDLFEEIGGDDDEVVDPDPGPDVSQPASPAEVVLALEHPDKVARLGGLYQIKPGDTLLTVAREALFGTRDPINDPDKRAAVLELAVRIDCSPWNQALYGASPEALNPDHPAVKNGWSQLGVSFNPIYTDNRSRMIAGQSPSAATGTKFAFIYIPMINLDLLDGEGRVTTEGMDYPDTMDGRGHNMIDPPLEILQMDFDDIVLDEVGCDLPEGDFRKQMSAN